MREIEIKRKKERKSQWVCVYLYTILMEVCMTRGTIKNARRERGKTYTAALRHIAQRCLGGGMGRTVRTESIIMLKHVISLNQTREVTTFETPGYFTANVFAWLTTDNTNHLLLATTSYLGQHISHQESTQTLGHITLLNQARAEVLHTHMYNIIEGCSI